LALVSSALSCSSPAATETAPCTPNTTQFCACAGDAPGAASGVQSCRADGRGWAQCECGAGTGDTSDTGGEEPICEPGSVASCTCEDGQSGDQVCSQGGAWYLPCECTADTGTDTGDPCLTEFEKQCVGDDLYWFDSCGVSEGKVGACENGCEAGECLGGCTPKDHKKCHADNPWWFDSCGEPDELIEECTGGQLCLNGLCAAPSYNGTWVLTADPDSKGLGAITLTFPLSTVEIKVSSTSVTMTGQAPHKTSFAGTLDGKKMTLTGSFVEQAEGIQHDATLIATFESAQGFSGSLLEDIAINDVPAGNVLWTVTGVRQ